MADSIIGKYSEETNTWYEEQINNIKQYQVQTFQNEQLLINKLNKLRIDNEEEIADYRIEQYTKYADTISNIEKEAAKRRIDIGLAASEEELEQQKELLRKSFAERAKLEAKAKGKEDLSDKEKKALDKKEKKELAALDKLYKNKEKLEQNILKETIKAQEKADEERAQKAGEEWAKNLNEDIFGKGKSLKDRFGALQTAFTDVGSGNGFKQGLAVLSKAMSGFAKQLETQIEEIAGAKTEIDTRLQGSSNKRKGAFFGLIGQGSYWDQISKDITGIAGASPLVKQSDIAQKVKELVGTGISFNIEQRAFLASISDKIATTFNVADSTLLRLVRIQQQDSTAARLGMESAMNAFLNNMYETTEYLNGVAESVRSSLEEAESLMGGTEALELEYQIQKWLGSLYSVGMSQGAISSLSNAIGQVAAGDISGLTGEGAGNLVIMAANNAGLSIADILTDGLNASDANNLMQAMVEYLALIYNESKTSKVVQQQFAKVYGITASDLKAALNLANDNGATIKNIANNNLTYNTAMNQLNSMASSMYNRVSMGQMMTNAWDNLKYTMSSGIANNPILYATYKVAGLLDDVVGGIALPDIKVMGNGVNLQTSVADLMNVAALSGSMLSGIGQMIAGGSAGGFSMPAALKSLGIGTGKISTVSRGSGSNLTTSNVTVSESGFAGNASGSDVYNKTMTDANDDSKAQMAEAKENEENDVTNKVIDEHIVSIYELLKDVVAGTSTLKVEMRDQFSWSNPASIVNTMIP